MLHNTFAISFADAALDNKLIYIAGMSARLAELRKAHRYTQEEVAEVLGVSTNHYALIERKKRSLRDVHIDKLCQLYSCKVSDLYDESPYGPRMQAGIEVLQQKNENGDLSKSVSDLLILISGFDEDRISALSDHAILLSQVRRLNKAS